MPFMDVVKSFVNNPTKLIANIHLRMPTNPSEKKHIFVVGAPRSGTTLMQTILSVHPNIVSSDEETGFFMLRDLFTMQIRGMSLKDYQVAIKNSRDIICLFDRIAAYFTNDDENKRFLEKTPQHILRLNFITKWFPNAQIVNMYRDGRDCFCSAKKHDGVPQGKNVKNYAHYWKLCVNKRLECKNSNIFDVKYENLTLEPKSVIQKLMNFLEEEFIEQQLDPKYYSRSKMSKLPEFHKLNMAINTSSVRKWEKEMSSHEQNIFLSIASSELKLLEYENN